MPLFIQFTEDLIEKLYHTIQSEEISLRIRREFGEIMDNTIIKKSINLFLENHDLWYDDVMNIAETQNKDGIAEYYGIKYSIQLLGLVVYNIGNQSLEEEHIINILKKKGYDPWA